MSGDPGPMVRRRQLGAALRAFRVRAGLSVTQAAERLLSAPSKISRIENGQRSATQRDVRDLGAVYELPVEIRDQLMALARESRQRAWWQEGRLDPALQTLIGMEGAATSIKDFEPFLVPGLLQTPEYARAVVDSYRHGNTAAAEAVLRARMQRQRILEQESPPRLAVVLDEAVIRRPVGGEAVMRRQLEHLIDSMEHHQVQLQIIPFAAGVHIGTLNGFIILEFDDPAPTIPETAIPGVVYVETLAGGTYYDQPGEVEKHLRAFTRLGKEALPCSRSRDMLRAIFDEL